LLKKGSLVKFYFNGTRVATLVAPTLADVEEGLFLGTRRDKNTNTSYTNATFTNLMVYNRALISSEVALLHDPNIQN